MPYDISRVYDHSQEQWQHSENNECISAAGPYLTHQKNEHVDACPYFSEPQPAFGFLQIALYDPGPYEAVYSIDQIVQRICPPPQIIQEDEVHVMDNHTVKQVHHRKQKEEPKIRVLTFIFMNRPLRL